MFNNKYTTNTALFFFFTYTNIKFPLRNYIKLILYLYRIIIDYFNPNNHSINLLNDRLSKPLAQHTPSNKPIHSLIWSALMIINFYVDKVRPIGKANSRINHCFIQSCISTVKAFIYIYFIKNLKLLKILYFINYLQYNWLFK